MLGSWFKTKFQSPAPTVTDGVVLPYPPILLNEDGRLLLKPQNVGDLKDYLNDKSPSGADLLIKRQKEKGLIYSPVTGSFPFGEDKTPPVFAQFWKHEKLAPCCWILSLRRADGRFSFFTQALVPFVIIFPGDPDSNMGWGVMTSRPKFVSDTSASENAIGVDVRVSGDAQFLGGVEYIGKDKAIKMMTAFARVAEAVAARKASPHRPVTPVETAELEMVKWAAQRFANG